MEEAVVSLARAAERFGRARRCGAEGTNGSSAQIVRLAHKELRAWTRLVKLWQDGGEEDEAEKCLNDSSHLLALVPNPPASPSAAEDWSDLLAAWALVATRAHRWKDAEEALQAKRRVAKAVGGTDPEVGALKELAVVYRRLGDEAKLKDTFGALSGLLPELTRARILEELWQELRHLPPIGGESRAKEDDAVNAANAAEAAAIAAQHPPPTEEERFAPARPLIADYRPYFGPEPPPRDPSVPTSWDERIVPDSGPNPQNASARGRWAQLGETKRLSAFVFMAALIVAFVVCWIGIRPHWVWDRLEL
jgi:hypothetical protein